VQKDKVGGGGRGEKVEDNDLSMHITPLNCNALKTTSVAKEFILSEVLGRVCQFFSSGHSVRIGWNDSSSLHAQKHKGDIIRISDITNDWLTTINRIVHNKVINNNHSQSTDVNLIPLHCIHYHHLQNGLNHDLLYRILVLIFQRL
jgi:hypothetical protein